MNWKIFLTSLSAHDRSELAAALHDEAIEGELSLNDHEVAMLANGASRKDVTWHILDRTRIGLSGQMYSLNIVVNAVDREIARQREHTLHPDTNKKS